MLQKFCQCLFTLLVFVVLQLKATTVIYHHPGTGVLSAYPLPAAVHHADTHEYHPGYTIVAPLTKLAHVTYDSVAIPHTPYEHVPLFQRIGHVKHVRL